MDKEWFNIDRAGLAATVARRGKSFAIHELVSNAWDAMPTKVGIKLEPLPNSPYCLLEVIDDSAEGWTDLSDAFTMFAKSRRAADSTKRGRFGSGEKLVLSICRKAKIATMNGTIIFDEEGRHNHPSNQLGKGTLIQCEIRMTREEFQEVNANICKLIPPVGIHTTYNGVPLTRPNVLKSFQINKLPTEIMIEGELRRTKQTSTVEVFNSDGDECGMIYELGVPVCEAGFPWIVNIQNKIPLNIERDSVTGEFKRALQVSVLNEMANRLNEEQAAKPWVTAAMDDSRVSKDAVSTVLTQRFGERVVIAVPGDPIANATAEANGTALLHGGSLPAGAWSAIKKHGILLTASQAYPTPKPDDNSGVQTCPLCKQLVRK